jgi:hypothetical protein
MTSEWTRYSIRTSDFNKPTSSYPNQGWPLVKDSVNTFSIFVANSGDIWLDDIRFHGVTKADLR